MSKYYLLKLLFLSLTQNHFCLCKSASHPYDLSSETTQTFLTSIWSHISLCKKSSLGNAQRKPAVSNKTKCPCIFRSRQPYDESNSRIAKIMKGKYSALFCYLYRTPIGTCNRILPQTHIIFQYVFSFLDKI